MSDTKQSITAEDFANLCGRCIVENSRLEKENQVLPTSIIKLHLEQFANLQSKFHVEKALKAASEKATSYVTANHRGDEYSVIDKDSILNAYDINKIG